MRRGVADDSRPRRTSGSAGLLTLAACLLFVTGAPALRAQLNTTSDGSLADCLSAVVPALPEITRGALDRIESDDRRLLAARSWLRSARTIEERWSWSEDEIARYETSEERATALAEIEKVKQAFAEAYPGHSLYVNTEVRSLELQISKWNRSAGVGKTAAELAAAAAGRCGAAADGRADEFVRWLKSFRPPTTSPLAAPGLSLHGRGRAFDFQIYKGRSLVAGTSTGRVSEEWDEAGWTERLSKIMTSASTAFQGPLTSPREPWHYNYTPPPVAATAD